MGALTAVILIVNWLRKLFLLDGQHVVMLTSGVALYVALTIFMAVYFPWVAIILGIVILAALLASGADAIVSQGKTASREGIAALKVGTDHADDNGDPTESNDDIANVSRSRRAS